MSDTACSVYFVEFRRGEFRFQVASTGVILSCKDGHGWSPIVPKEALALLAHPVPDTHELEARAGGLDKAAEICRYHASLPMRNEASKAMARDIEVSCLATAGRIRRGEYENPTSDVMQTEKDSPCDSHKEFHPHCEECGLWDQKRQTGTGKKI